MTIDAKELREAIAMFRKEVVPASRLFGLIADAAEAHLASLPREVTFTRYLVVTDRDELGPYPEKDVAENLARRRNGVVVPLNGTALLPPQKD